MAYRSIASSSRAVRTNTTLTAPSGIVNGDILLLWHTNALTTTAPTATPPAGFALVPGPSFPSVVSSGGTEMRAWCWYKVASGESGNYTTTHASCTSQSYMVVYSGRDPTTPFHTDSTLNTGTGVTTTWLGVTTTAPNVEFVLFDHDWGNTANNLLAPTGTTPSLTERIDAATSYIYDGIWTSSGASGNRTQTNNSSSGNPWAAVLNTLNPSPTPIFVCGGECNIAGVGIVSAAVNEHWSAISGTPTIVTAPASRGGKAIQCAPAGAVVNLTHTLATAIASPATMVARFYLYFTTLPSANCNLFQTNLGTGLYFTATGATLRGGSATGAQAASGIAVTTGTWYQIDLKIVTNTTRTVDLQVNGVAATQYTQSSSAATNTTFILGTTTGSITGSWAYDDLVVSGISAEYPIGAGRVAGLYPNSDGTHNISASTFEKNGTSSTTIPPSDTTAWQSLKNPLSIAVDNAVYINDAAGANTAYVEFGFDDLPAEAAGVAGLSVVATNHSGGATANNCRMRLNDGGDITGYVYGTAAPAYADLSETDIVCSHKTFAFSPSTVTTPWTVSKVNAVKVQWGLASDVAPDPFLDGVMLEVAYFEEAASGDATATAIAVAVTTTRPAPLCTTLNTVVAQARTATAPQASASTATNGTATAIAQARTVTVPAASASAPGGGGAITTPVNRGGVVNEVDATTTLATASFTPTAGSLLVACVWLYTFASDPTTIALSSSFSDTGGGSWTRQVQVTFAQTDDYRMEIWTRQVGTSPGAGTVTATYTFTAGADKQLGVWEITGHDPTTPVPSGQFASNVATSTAVTATLPNTPAATSIVFSAAGSALHNSTAVGPTNHTELTDAPFDGDYYGASYDNASAAATANWTGMTSSTTGTAAVAIEIQAAAAGGDATADAIVQARTTTRGTTVANTANTVTALTPTALDSAVFNSTANTVTTQARTTVPGTPTALTSSVAVAITVARTTTRGTTTANTANTVTAQARTATISPASATVAAVATAITVAPTAAIGTASATGDAVVTAISQARTTTIGTATATGDAVTTATAVTATATVPLASASAVSDATATAIVFAASALDQAITGSTANTVIGHGHASARPLRLGSVENMVTTVARTITTSAVVGTGTAVATATPALALATLPAATATGTAIVTAVAVSAVATIPLALADGTVGGVTASAITVVVTALDQVANADVTALALTQARTITTNAITGTGDAVTTAPVVVVTAFDSVATATGSGVATATVVVATALDQVVTATGTAVVTATVVVVTALDQAVTGSTANTVTSYAAVALDQVASATGTAVATAIGIVATALDQVITGTGTAVTTAQAVVVTAVISAANAIGEGTGTGTAVFRVVTATAPAASATGTATVTAGPVGIAILAGPLTGSTANTVTARSGLAVVPLAVASGANDATAAAVFVPATTSVSALSGGAGGTVAVVVVIATLPQPQGGAGGITAALAVSVVCAAPSGGAGGTLAPATATATTPLATASGESVVVASAGPVGVAVLIGPLLGGASGTVDPVVATVMVLGLIFFSGKYPGGVIVTDEGGPGTVAGVDTGGGVLVGGDVAVGVTTRVDGGGASTHANGGGVMVGAS